MLHFRNKLSYLSLVAMLIATPAHHATAASHAVEGAGDISQTATHAAAVTACYVERESPAGMSFAVFHNGQMVRSDGFGWADLEQRVPVTPETRFRMASVSKLVTAGAIAQLWQAGRLDLDAPVRTYVPDFPEKRWPVSVRQLAGHIGGIRGYEDKDFAPGNDINQRHFETTEDALTIFSSDPLIFEPGTGYRYSTFGFTLLSAVVEQVSGKPYDQYIHDDLLSPIGVTAIVADNPDELIPHRGRYFDVADDGRLVNAKYVRSDYKFGGGGLLGTAEDLARFGSAHMESGLFSNQSLQDGLFKAQVRADGRPVHVGLGWRIGSDPTFGRVFHHSGSLPGARSVLMVWPDQGLAVAAMSNTTNTPYNAEDFADVLSRIMLEAQPAPPTADPISLDLVFDGKEGATIRHLVTKAGGTCEGSLQTPAYLKVELETRGYRAPESLNVMGSYFKANGKLVILAASRLGLHRVEVDMLSRTGAMVDLDNKFTWSFEQHSFSVR